MFTSGTARRISCRITFALLHLASVFNMQIRLYIFFCFLKKAITFFFSLFFLAEQEERSSSRLDWQSRPIMRHYKGVLIYLAKEICLMVILEGFFQP